MHLLKAQPGVVADGSEAVDLGQTPGDIVVLSAADTELASLAAARGTLGEAFPAVRLANLMQLSHHASVDLYCETVVAGARLVIVRLLGGKSYWPYGVEQIAETCASTGAALALLPGDDQPDPELAAYSTVDAETCRRLWSFLLHGGAANAGSFLACAASLIGRRFDWREPAELPRAGIWWPGLDRPGLGDLRRAWAHEGPVAALVFYRALVQADNTAPIVALIESLGRHGIDCLPMYCTSLKDPVSAGVVESLLVESGAGIVLNGTGFAVSTPGRPAADSPLNATDAPVLQLVFSGGNEKDWRAATRGLSARDVAMNVALPEVDGRIISRAVSFKGETRFDESTQCPLVVYEPVPDRVEFVARLAARWLRLRRTPVGRRRLALILANYPNRDGRLGNGVGLDTPASVVALLRTLERAGYGVTDVPRDGDRLIERLRRGPTNAATDGREVTVTLKLRDYRRHFDALPAAVRRRVVERWGDPRQDPFYLAASGALDDPDDPDDPGAFALPAFRCGNAVVGLQPARGYHIDPQSSYHDPDLVPPHGYFAFYAWLRAVEDVHAVIHVGKHGNLEWLPGKALALGETCFPEAVFGPLPHLYPFIVNDPGEGTQAKRRAQAVIVDHLTPPLTRAGTYGPLAELELLVDEYFEAAGVDPRRLKILREEILSLAAHVGLDRDCGIEAADDHDTALAKLDNLPLRAEGDADPGRPARARPFAGRGGAGRPPGVHGPAAARRPRARRRLADARARRRSGPGGVRPPVRRPRGALARTPPRRAGPALAFPLAHPRRYRRAAGALGPRSRRGQPRNPSPAGPAPARCSNSSSATCARGWWPRVRPSSMRAGRPSTGGSSRRVPRGRRREGRLDVLPTGRNFYSVDTRTVPTPAAWKLGWQSAALLLERHRQEHGAWPKRIALSAWGTANMRTGGDDVAQALALMGVKPTWETASRRVTGFEILPLDLLDRPRVDVTLRISGFFRDAFPSQIDLFDSAARAVAALDETERSNPLAASVRAEAARLAAAGADAATAARRAGFRVFGSKPGAYGAGLQALIDERGWETEADLARAYVAWGGYAYGAGAEGAAEHGLFEARLAGVEAVLHNQDNREHDLLDSDDYYQFEGGLAVAVEHLGGARPAVYHNDHSRPETPRIRTLKEEIARVVRARVVNPKWIAAMQRHGYKGGFEMAATLDYLFAFAATTGMVENHHFDAVYTAFMEDESVRGFLARKNPDALREMADRFLEAVERGLWKPRSNSARGALRAVADGPAPSRAHTGAPQAP